MVIKMSNISKICIFHFRNPYIGYMRILNTIWHFTLTFRHS